jgi:hypothetical protein
MADQSHHFVPQMYLRAFLDREQVAKGQNVLWSYRAGMKPFARGTKAIGAKTLFYQMPELPEHQDDIEAAFSKLETVAASRLEKLRSGDIKLTGQEKAEFAWFVAASAVRTPFFRDLTNAIAMEHHRKRMETLLQAGVMEEAAGKLEAQTGEPVDTSSVREFAEKVVTKEIEMTQESKAWNMKQMFDHIADFGERFEKMRWGLLEAPDDTPFITSDNPVIVLDDNAKKLGPQKYRPTSGLRFGFPLSPKFALSGEYVNGADQRLKASAHWVQVFNSSQISRAYVEVYASFKSMELQAEIDKVHKERPSIVPDLPADYSRFDMEGPRGSRSSP